MLKRPSTLLLCFLLFFPLVQAVLYFVIMADWSTAIQQGTYSATKIIMLGFPLVYMLKVAKEPFLVRKFNTRGLLEGSVFGIGVLVAICLLYYLWLKPIGLIGPGTSAGDAIRERVSGFGIQMPTLFILFGCFVSLIHSGLEEYYWRWFTFSQLSRVVSKYAACIISGLGFMLHHIVILGVYFGFDNPAAYLFSFGVGVGGMYWAWLYMRKDSIYAPWLSHVWIDLAIFIIGYDVVFS
jgi:membrane protease YdiL (CAAX protease family)